VAEQAEIDRLCDRFEAAWQAGRQPRLERYLAAAPKSARLQLFGELLFLELAYRSRRGDDLKLEEYLNRFWRYGTSLHSVFEQADWKTPAHAHRLVGAGPAEEAGQPAVCPATGIELGDYELLNKLGQSGMGTVYRARQRSADRIVALKVVRSDRLEALSPEERQEWLERFRREARIAARIDHPGVIHVYDVGEAGGQFFYSMRYVEGRSLAEILREGPVACRLAASSIERVARADEAIHGLGIVHRDLKPRNILVDAAGQPFVTDFGLARWLASASDITHSQAWLGTPSYMAPEQAQDPGRAAAASDVYSLGATLYELLAGRPPFRASDPLETLRQVVGEEPVPPRRLNPAIDRDMELICLKCLQKEPARRYASAGQLADELQRYRKHEPLAHTRPAGWLMRTRRWSRRNPARATASLLAGVLLACIVGFSILFGIYSTRAGERLQAANLETGRQAASWALDWGVSLCERGECDHGVLWMTRALETIRANAPDLQWDIRSNLSGWKSHLNTLQACVATGGNALALAFTAEGPRVLTISHDGRLRLWNAISGNALDLPFRHQGEVLTGAFSPDGHTLVTGGWDGTARRWQVATGSAVGLALEDRTPISAVAFSPDHKKIATGSTDGAARVWDAATGLPIGQPQHHQKAVIAIAFSADSKLLLTGSMDQTARLWEAATGRLLAQPLGHKGVVITVAFSPDGKVLLTGSNDSTAQLWKTATGQPLAPPLHHQGGVAPASFSPNGKTVLTGGADRTARLWSAATGEPLSIPIAHHGEVLTVAFSPDGRWFLTGSSDGIAQLWDRASQRPLGSPLRHGGAVRRVALSSDGRNVLTWSADEKIRLWDVPKGGLLRALLPHDKEVYAAAFSSDGKNILTAGYDATARLWDATSGHPLCPPLHMPARIQCAAFDPNGQVVAAGSADGSAQLWQLPEGRPLGPPLRHTGWVSALAFSPDGAMLLTGGVDNTAILWNAADRTPIHPPFRHLGGVLAVAFSPDGTSILTGSADNTAQLWHAATGEPATPPLRHGDWIQAVAFSPDNRLVLTGSKDRTARLWDAATGQLLQILHHDGQIHAVAFSSDGKMVLTASADHTAQLWDTATGQPAGALQHQDEVHGAVFSPDGRLAATASADGSARFWDTRTSKPIGPPLVHPFGVYRVAFSPDARTLLTAGQDKNARLWDVSQPLGGTMDEITESIQLCTGAELLPSGAFRELDAQTWQGRRTRLAGLPKAGPLAISKEAGDQAAEDR
jgi:WD40 repeat protein/predicted Ser/Thr protein kinase